MDQSANLDLPLLMPSQAQKHITHNEALLRLDAVVQLAVLARHLTAPPGSPADGDRYIVAEGATGAWDGWDDSIAVRAAGAWTEIAPRPGWLCWVDSEHRLLVWDGAAWTPVAATIEELNDLELLGVLATADSSNRLAVKSDGVLFSHDDVTPGSGDARITINKSAAGKDAGFVVQDAFSTRAVLGLLGDDNLSLKVSPDGSAFATALIARKDSGQVDLPAAPKFAAYINYDQYIGANAWAKIGINNARHNDQAAFDAANNRFVAPADGYYLFGAKYRFKANATVPTSIHIGFGKNNAAPATGDDECGLQGTIVTLVSCVQHTQLYKLAAGDTIDVRAYMATNDGYCESGHVSFWGHRVA